MKKCVGIKCIRGFLTLVYLDKIDIIYQKGCDRIDDIPIVSRIRSVTQVCPDSWNIILYTMHRLQFLWKQNSFIVTDVGLHCAAITVQFSLAYTLTGLI